MGCAQGGTPRGAEGPQGVLPLCGPPAPTRATMAWMATEPQRDPIEDEADRVLAENPGLREELEEFGRAYDAGQIPDADLIPHEEVRRRLARLGVPLPPPPEP